jgi:hypothetical protein
MNLRVLTHAELTYLMRLSGEECLSFMDIRVMSCFQKDTPSALQDKKFDAV